MKLGHGNCHKSHGKVMEKSWKFVGKNVYEPCILMPKNCLCWHKMLVKVARHFIYFKLHFMHFMQNKHFLIVLYCDIFLISGLFQFLFHV